MSDMIDFKKLADRFKDKEETSFSDLENLDEMYDEAAEPETDNVPDGKYLVRVDRVEIKQARQSGANMLAWELLIVGPSHAGRKLFRRNMLVTRDNLGWLKADLRKCNIQLAKLSDLPGRLEDLLDLELQVTVRTRGDNQNVYIDKCTTKYPRSVTEAAMAGTFNPNNTRPMKDPDDIPF